MPPQSPTPNIPQQPVRSGKPSSGPIVGIIIIVLLMLVGALYFWGARLNQRDIDQLPLIPPDNSTTSAQ